MDQKLIAWMECKPVDVSFEVVFGSKTEARQWAKRQGLVIKSWRRR